MINISPIANEPPGTAFLANLASNGRPVEVHLLPWLAQRPDLITAAHHQVRLAQLIAPSYSLPLAELHLENNPPKIVLDLAATQPLDSWLDQADSSHRLRLTHALANHFIAAIASGLLHGCLTSRSIHVAADGSPRIDYLSRFYSLRTANCEPDSIEEATAVNAVLRRITLLIKSDATFFQQLDRQTRSALTQLCRPEDHPQCPLTTLGNWNQVLAKFASDSAKEVVANPDSNPATRPQANVQNLAQQEFNNIGDATCEVQVDTRRSLVVAAVDDSTRELSADDANETSDLNQLPKPGDRLGRYQLQSILGSGAMGIVFKAIDLSEDQTVALKVLKTHGTDIAQSIRRFKKEARILSSVQNDFVTRLIEISVEGSHHFIAMEYVAGTNLKDWLQSQGNLDEPTALQLIGDIARALVDAHRLDIIHRDIKPENVLLQHKTEINVSASDNIGSLPLENFRVKLTDFGIARAVNQSASMDVTRAGSLLGTPTFMSPEQYKGKGSVGPAADIYSLGVSLYMMLCGQPPFVSSDPMKLAAMHCFDSPVSIQKRNQSISDRTTSLVARMLAKDPLQRFADASQLVREIDKILGGEPCDIQSHPRLPISGKSKIWEKVHTWNCSSTPAELWPLVSNTERLNRAAGLQSVKYRLEKKPEGGLRRFGSIRIAGMKIEWEEHPFEWIEGTRMGVLREFQSGPFAWFASIVELFPRPEGGTRLQHTIRIEPRNIVGRAVATIEAGWKAGKSLDRVYRRIDNVVRARRAAKNGANANPTTVPEDHFEAPQKLTPPRQRRIEERTEQMVRMRIASSVADKLADYIRNSTPQSLARIRPLELATNLRISTDECVDACLVATKCGLLVIKWDLLCPTCRVPAATRSLLSEIDAHTECEACDVHFQSNLAAAIELIFQADPEVADIDLAQYCVGGPAHTPHVVSQLRLEPHERMEIAVPLSVGEYLIRGPGLVNSQPFRVRAGAAPSQLEIRLSRLGSSHHTPQVRVGNASFTITNDLDSHQIVRFERALDRNDVITAAAASTLPRFRELFPEQTFKRDLPIASEQLTLLGVRISNAQQLYAEMGDADAYVKIQQVMQQLENLTNAHRGAIIKTVGEFLLAAFQDSNHAIIAAIAMGKRQNELQDEVLTEAEPSTIEDNPNTQPSYPIKLGIGLHRGTTLVTTQNGRLDYFGATPRLLENITQLADNKILMTESVFSDSAVQVEILKNQLSCETILNSNRLAPSQYIQQIDIDQPSLNTQQMVGKKVSGTFFPAIT